METQELAERLARIRNSIGDGVELVAASKTRDIGTIRKAHGLGVKVFGENRVQELIDKYDPELTWDFIGRLQTNKVKYLIGKVRLIQSVDRRSLAEVIDKEAAKKRVVQDVLIEINAGREEDKGGVFIENATELAEFIATLENVRLRGIMAVMPISDDKEYLGGLFEECRKLYEELKLKMPHIDCYSGGMSGDFEIAVRHGVNIVRVGRALFGERTAVGI